jgi:hypothetical protein
MWSVCVSQLGFAWWWWWWWWCSGRGCTGSNGGWCDGGTRWCDGDERHNEHNWCAWCNGAESDGTWGDGPRWRND